MDTEIGYHSSITQNQYTLPLKCTQGVEIELEMLLISGIIIQRVSPWCSYLVIVQPSEILQKDHLWTILI